MQEPYNGHLRFGNRRQPNTMKPNFPQRPKAQPKRPCTQCNVAPNKQTKLVQKSVKNPQAANVKISYGPSSRTSGKIPTYSNRHFKTNTVQKNNNPSKTAQKCTHSHS